jgi:coproporphyrinogen III oxidase-like Fe-S oxidoreductase
MYKNLFGEKEREALKDASKSTSQEAYKKFMTKGHSYLDESLIGRVADLRWWEKNHPEKYSQEIKKMNSEIEKGRWMEKEKERLEAVAEAKKKADAEDDKWVDELQSRLVVT